MAKLFQTGDSSNNDLSKVTLELTTDSWFRRAFLRALILLTQEENWQQDGTATIDYARDKANEMYVSAVFDYVPPVMTPVGATMIWHMDDPPDRWVICNGMGILISEYPELYALWGDKYGSGGGFFGTPDMRERYPYGAWSAHVLDEEFGEAFHTLTVNEMPSHTHRVPKQSATVDAAVNVATPAARVDNTATPHITTGSTGGGLPHNNLPPSLGVHFIAYGGLAP